MNGLKAVASGLVVVAGFLIGSNPAAAGPKGSPQGFGGSKFSGGFGHSSKFSGGFGSSKFHHHGGGFGNSGPFVPVHKHWHDTSHFDVHGGGWMWNGFGWVYVPAHVHWHQTGHFHNHHH